MHPVVNPVVCLLNAKLPILRPAVSYNLWVGRLLVLRWVSAVLGWDHDWGALSPRGVSPRAVSTRRAFGSDDATDGHEESVPSKSSATLANALDVNSE